MGGGERGLRQRVVRAGTGRTDQNDPLQSNSSLPPSLPSMSLFLAALPSLVCQERKAVYLAQSLAEGRKKLQSPSSALLSARETEFGGMMVSGSMPRCPVQPDACDPTPMAPADEESWGCTG